MTRPLDVCVRGGGVVGRALALLLARERLRVGLVAAPAADPSADDVRAYALNAASRRLLESLRAWPDESRATPVSRMQVRGDDGGALQFSAAGEGVDALAWIVDVAPLEHLLDEALRYQGGVERLAGPADATLSVVCEGRDSATRSALGAGWDAVDYGQHAIATRAQCAKPHAGAAHQWFRHGEVLALLPLGGAAGNSVAIVWSVPQARAAELLRLDDAGFGAALFEACGDELGAMTVGARAAWPLQVAQADRWTGPGWALAGDAAHTVHPLAGQGLNLGLADAAELARVLGSREYWRSLGDARLLRRYERARKGQVLAMRAATDGLERLFGLPGGARQLLRNTGMSLFERSGPVKHWVARQAMGLA